MTAPPATSTACVSSPHHGPGYGGSTALPGRRVVDAAHDTAGLLDALGESMAASFGLPCVSAWAAGSTTTRPSPRRGGPVHLPRSIDRMLDELVTSAHA